MKLKIEFADNFVTKKMITQSNIPCLCRVSGQLFEIAFQSPLQEVAGIVEEWDRNLLEERAVAGAGRNFTHYKHGMVTLSEIQKGLYKIIDLSFFIPIMGGVLY